MTGASVSGHDRALPLLQVPVVMTGAHATGQNRAPAPAPEPVIVLSHRAGQPAVDADILAGDIGRHV